jgi:hypothetical protein
LFHFQYPIPRAKNIEDGTIFALYATS